MKLAFVFPGQGSQSVGMLEAYAGLPGVAAAREAAGAVLATRQARGEPVRIESRLVDGAGGLRSLLVWIPAALPREAPPSGL